MSRFLLAVLAARPMLSQAYRIVLAQMVSLFKEHLLGVHLLQIAVRVAVQLHAVRCRRDRLVWAMYLLLRLCEGSGTGLIVVGHTIVEEAVAMAHVLRLLRAHSSTTMGVWNVRGKVTLEMLNAEGISQVGHLLAVGSSMAVSGDGEV